MLTAGVLAGLVRFAVKTEIIGQTIRAELFCCTALRTIRTTSDVDNVVLNI